jgi:hypothetical protein
MKVEGGGCIHAGTNQGVHKKYGMFELS